MLREAPEVQHQTAVPQQAGPVQLRQASVTWFFLVAAALTEPPQPAAEAEEAQAREVPEEMPPEQPQVQVQPNMAVTAPQAGQREVMDQQALFMAAAAAEHTSITIQTVPAAAELRDWW